MSDLSIDFLGSRNITQSYELSLTSGHSQGERVEIGDLLERSLWIQEERNWRTQTHLCYKALFFYSIIHCTVINTFSRIKAALEIDIVQGREPDQSTHDKVLI
jgi:hypothetical protein